MFWHTLGGGRHMSSSSGSRGAEHGSCAAATPAWFGHVRSYCRQEQGGHTCISRIPPASPQGMRKEEPEADVRHAATVALQNALTFAHNNFSNDAERNYIMQIICEGTLAGASRGAVLRRPMSPAAVDPCDAHDTCT